MTQDPSTEEQLRRRAEKRLRAKRDLGAHVLAYVMVNTLLVTVWFMTSPTSFFWPIFPLLGWGIGLAFSVWEVYSPQPSEDRIKREMERLRGQ